MGGGAERSGCRPNKAALTLDATARWMAALAADWDRRLANINRVAEAAAAGECAVRRLDQGCG